MAQSNRTGGECALIPLAAEPKSAAWKIALAAWLKRRCSAPNRARTGKHPNDRRTDTQQGKHRGNHREAKFHGELT